MARWSEGAFSIALPIKIQVNALRTAALVLAIGLGTGAAAPQLSATPAAQPSKSNAADHAPSAVVAGGKSKTEAKTIVDILGNTRKSQNVPLKIVSTCLTCDEIIIGILKQSNKLDRLIAVSKIAEDPRYSNISAELATIPQRAGSEIESIIKMQPDIVFITEFNRPEFRAALKKANVPTFALGPFNNLADVLGAIETTGEVLGEPGAATLIKNQLLMTLEEVRNSIPKEIRSNPTSAPTVLSFAPDGTVVGANTPFDGIVRAAGAINLPSQHGINGWPRMSMETLATWTPDWIITGGLETDRPAIIKSIQNAPGWRHIPAVKAGRIIIVPDALLLTTSQHVAKTIIMLNRAVYPAVEIVKSSNKSGVSAK